MLRIIFTYIKIYWIPTAFRISLAYSGYQQDGKSPWAIKEEMAIHENVTIKGYCRPSRIQRS